jgi:Tol biopolymer transport system component
MGRVVVTFGLLLSLVLASSGVPAEPGVRNGKIAFSVSAGYHSNLCLINPNGTRRMRLTRGRRQDHYASWSPDGRRLAFGREASPRVVGSQEGRNSRILVLGPNRASTNISDAPDSFPGDGYPSWSPDGASIAFTDVPWRFGRPSLWVMGDDGSDRRLLVQQAGEASWSPDGRLIAYDALPGPVPAPTGLAIIGIDGTGQRLLAAEGWGPAWSPDGATIAFERAAGIFTIATDGSGERLLIADGQGADWSPDGARLVFVRRGDLFIADADGSNVRQLTKTRAQEYAPAWQPVRAAGTARRWDRRSPAC